MQTMQMGGNPFMSQGPGMMPGSMGPGMMPGSMGPGMMPGGGMGPGMMPGSMGPGMMPGSMGPGMMPGGGMGGGMMPGGMGGFSQYGTPSITMQDIPNQRTIDERQFPAMPMPWQGAPQMLMPGQATGMGPDNLHPLMQQQMVGGQQRLPNAYRMYGYGPREIFWSTPVPVPEANTGIMVNAEYPLTRAMEGREVTSWDYGIRNSTWQQQGPWVQPYDPVRDMPDWKHKNFGAYETACDLKKPRHVKENMDSYYRNLNSTREGKGLFSRSANDGDGGMSLEIMDERTLHEFWTNPEAVVHEGLEP